MAVVVGVVGVVVRCVLTAVGAAEIGIDVDKDSVGAAADIDVVATVPVAVSLTASQLVDCAGFVPLIADGGPTIADEPPLRVALAAER